MSGTFETFKDWLAERVGEGDERVSRRELARRLADGAGGASDAESHRRSVRRILVGKINPSQTTRDSIQRALGDWSAPSVKEEEQAKKDAMEALARDPELVQALMPALRILQARTQS